MRFTTITALVALSLLFFVGCGKANHSPDSAAINTNKSQPTSNQNTNSVNSSVNTPQYSSSGILPATEIQNKQIRIKTAKGEIVFELYPDTAPLAVSNFISLTKQKFYDGLTFHRRVEGFVIQGGDPEGTGRGGPGYRFNDELTDQHEYDRGIVAMANAGPNTNGSQFFIMLADYPLPKQYTIFGKVVEGLDVVDQIKVGDVMNSVTVEDKK